MIYVTTHALDKLTQIAREHGDFKVKAGPNEGEVVVLLSTGVQYKITAGGDCIEIPKIELKSFYFQIEGSLDIDGGQEEASERLFDTLKTAEGFEDIQIRNVGLQEKPTVVPA